ncbi:hypothetical protein [Zoogloea sp.]|uniref:YybH family protein n=1 Tax=Zoogloea sp. TaxID=49181 RepID=UPI0014157136|nr:MAG: nuclear transport factor 2 family protein [Zoogloea sp.]
MKSLTQSQNYHPNASLSPGQTLMWIVGGVMLMFMMISILFVVKLGSEGRLPFFQKRPLYVAPATPENNAAKAAQAPVAPPVPASSTETPAVEVTPEALHPEPKANFVAGAESVLPSDIAQLSKEDTSNRTTAPSNPAPAATSTPPAEQGSGPAEEVARSIEGWVRDWESKDINAYLAHYAPDFRPANQVGYNTWQQQRKERLGRPGELSIRISSPEIKINGERATARFVQNYAGGGQRLSEIKTLDLVRNEQRWLIVAERIGQ